MKIECPKCNSTEFTKLSLIHVQGFSDLEVRSRGWGVMFGSGGADLGFGKFRTKGQIQTKLSQKVSPPRKWSYWKIMLGALIGLLVLEFILGYVDTVLRTGGSFNQQLAWFGYAWLGIVTIIVCITFRHNVWAVPKRRRLWDRSFMCRRCGRILQLPDSNDSASLAVVRDGQR